jgi:hypothetical protein
MIANYVRPYDDNEYRNSRILAEKKRKYEEFSSLREKESLWSSQGAFLNREWVRTEKIRVRDQELSLRSGSSADGSLTS